MIPNQEEEMAKLPPGVRAQVEKLVAGNDDIAGIKVIGVPRDAATLGGRVGDGDEFDGKKPIRSVKLTPKLLALTEEIAAFSKKAAAEAKRLDERKAALMSQARDLKSKVWAHVAVDMGFSLARFEMQINHDRKELEIMTDSRPNEPWPKAAAAKKSGKKK